MTKDEALKMAIKALLTGHHHTDLCNEAVNACKEALEQPINEFNPDWDATEEIVKENINLHQKIEALEQPAQEPVGVVSWHEGIVMGSIFPSSTMPKDGDLLYTHPAQPLSDDEIGKLFSEFIASHHTPSDSFKVIAGFARAIEQALKEKNG